MINNKGYWPYRVEVGDVITNGKSFRVVRSAKQGSSGYTTFVDLAIRRCSWTKRPYTCLSYIDLSIRNFRPVGIKVKLDSVIDKRIADDIQDPDLRKTFCCDVLGVS